MKTGIAKIGTKIGSSRLKTQTKSNGCFEEFDILKCRREHIPYQRIVFGLEFQTGSLRRSPVVNNYKLSADIS